MADFTPELCERIRRLVGTYGVNQTAELLGLHQPVISKLKARGYTPTKRGRYLRPVPSDFAIMQNHMTVKQMAVHYRTCGSIVTRWIGEVGGRRYEAKPANRVYTKKPAPANLRALLLEHGAKATAKIIGVSQSTLERMRRDEGLPVKSYPKRSNDNDRIHWAERYVEERRA